MATAVPSWGLKQPELEFEHPPSSGVEVKNEWISAFYPPHHHVLMQWAVKLSFSSTLIAR
jgi:hypothetical protein